MYVDLSTLEIADNGRSSIPGPEKTPSQSLPKSSFNSLSEARDCLDCRIQMMLSLNANPNTPYEKSYEAQSLLQQLHDSLENYSGNGWPSDKNLMHVHYRAAVVLAMKYPSTTEMVFDQSNDDFTYIITRYRDLLENSQIQSSAVFADGLGLIPPLYLVASRCRDPFLRREAIALLRVMHRHEGNLIPTLKPWHTLLMIFQVYGILVRPRSWPNK